MTQHDVHSYTDLAQGKIKHLAIDWDVDFEKKIIHSSVTYILEQYDGPYLDLDARDITVLCITAHDKEVRYEIVENDPIRHDCLRIYLPEGTHSFTIDYNTSPEASGILWMSAEQTIGKKEPFVFLHFEQIHTRSAIPFQDSPEVRITYDAEVTIPDHLKVAMAAELPEIISSNTEKKTATYRFHMPNAIPSYLMGMCVGRFEYKEISNRIRVYAEPEILDAAANEFKNGDKALQIAETIFGKYLWGRADLIIMPHGFGYGGMECPRLILMAPTVITGDGTSLDTLDHEFGHFWFGNNVTNATWEDFWINEGFTSYAEYRILEQREGPESAMMHKVVRNELMYGDFVEVGGKDVEITKLKPNLKDIDPDEMFSTIPYTKGAQLLILMEEEAGRDHFDHFLREMIENFQFSSISTETFLDYLDAELPGIREKVKADEWIYQTGIPDNAPKFHSDKVEKIRSYSTRFNDHVLTEEETKEWGAKEWILFVYSLPKKANKGMFQSYDELYSLNKHPNLEIRHKWLEQAIDAGADNVYEDVEEICASTGRGKFLEPLFRALACRADTNQMAHDLYAKYKPTYYIAIKTRIERVLRLGDS